VKQELERVVIPGEVEAYGRTWVMLEAAFADRQPVPRPSHWPQVAAIAVALAALLASAFSPPGQAVIDEIREVVGVEKAQRALFSLPAEGRLLVASEAGVWVVQADGSKRLLGGYREASWSPFGRFVVVARRDELAAFEPNGKVRWTLARRGVTSPRWTGTETDTRIAYVDRTGVRLIAGDGTGDRLLVPRARGPIAWRPGPGFVLSYVDERRRVRTVDVETGRSFWMRPPLASGRFPDARELVWSADGSRLLLVRRRMVLVFGSESAEPLGLRQVRGVADAVFEPGSHRFAVARTDDVILLNADRVGAEPERLFAGAAGFESLAWSPRGPWTLVGWPTADQWIFVRADGKSIRAVSNVSEQFRSRSFPRVEGWCCAP
jgi:hypothetical protein